MKVEELLKPFPIKEFHPMNRGLLGPGAHEIIGPEAIKLGFRKPLVMTTGLRGSDTVHKIVESLKYHGLDVAVFDKIESNPKDYNVMDAVALYQAEKCDSMVSIGGGSAHDACKGARISIAHDGRNVNEFEGFNKSENPKNPPHIAVSTTAGTGSETSWAYVITDTTTDPGNPHKYVAFDDAALCTLAIDDPVLYYDVPKDYTAQCGFDVLAHASEPYVSRLNFWPSLGNGLYAIKLLWQNLRQAVWNPVDLPGKEGMMYSQYIATQAFNSGGLGIVHSISHAVSAFYDTHHGLNNAIALPRVWAYNMSDGLRAVRRHRRGHGHRHARHDQAAGGGRGVEGGRPAAPRRGHLRRALRRHPARTATSRTGWGRVRPSSTRTPRRSRGTPPTSTGSPGTSWATPARPATRRSASSRPSVRWSTTA